MFSLSLHDGSNSSNYISEGGSERPREGDTVSCKFLVASESGLSRIGKAEPSLAWLMLCLGPCTEVRLCNALYRLYSLASNNNRHTNKDRGPEDILVEVVR